MVVIRLARAGKKKQPFHRIVVTDSRRPRDGRYIELLGYYDPNARGQAIAYRIKADRYKHWFSKGARPSSRVKQLVKKYEAQITSAQTDLCAEAVL